MIKRIVQLLLVIGLVWGQSKIDINNLIDRGGLLYATNDNKPYTGLVFEFYENSQKKLNGRYRNGVKNGKWTWRNMDGGMNSTGTYKNGLMNELWKYYYKNGQINGQGRFIDGDGGNVSKLSGFPRNGRVGKWTFYYENGKKKEALTYKDGIKVGQWTKWHENGQKMYAETYKDGKNDGLWAAWNKNGQKTSEGTRKDGEYFLSNSWNKNGEIMIKDGNGKWSQWHENGQKSVEYPYKGGKADGLWTSWYDNGNKKYEVTFKVGEKISQNCWDEDENKCECSENWWEGCK